MTDEMKKSAKNIGMAIAFVVSGFMGGVVLLPQASSAPPIPTSMQVDTAASIARLEEKIDALGNRVDEIRDDVRELARARLLPVN